MSATEKALNESKANLTTTTATLQTTTKLLSDTQAGLKSSEETNKRLQSQIKERSEAPKPPVVEDDTKAAPAPKAKAADGS